MKDIDHIVGEADTDKTIDIAVGEALQIELVENATAGYRWALDDLDTSICVLKSEEQRSPDKNIPGASGTHIWILTAMNAGKCIVDLVYQRRWEVNVAPSREFKIHLRVRAQG